MSFRAKWTAALRVLGVLVVFGMAAGFLGVRSAEARLEEALFSVSATFLGPMGADERPRHLSLNGLQFQVTSRTLNEGLAEVLGRFEKACRARTVRFPVEGLASTVRFESETEGVVACIDTHEQIDVAEFWRRLDAFIQGGDLATVGDLRYLYASEHLGKTTILLVASEGPLPVRAAFPSEGDAPGTDVGPRPHGTTRLLSAFEQGYPYAVAAYRSEPGVRWSNDQLRDFLQHEGLSVRATSGRSLVATRGGETFVVASRASPRRETIFTVIRLGE